MNIKKDIIIILYINDLLIIDYNKIIIEITKIAFNVKFYISNFRLYAYYLDITIKRNCYINIIYLN